MKIVYKRKQLEEAAKFIFEHNDGFCNYHNVTKPEHVEVHILNHIKDFVELGYRKGAQWSATGGWIVVPRQCGSDVVNVDLYVEPSIMYAFHDLQEETLC